MFRSSYWKGNYDEMMTFMPRFYWDVYEMNAILRIQGMLADGVDEGLETVVNNCFIDTMDEDTIAVLEKYLGLSLLKSRTLEERRRLVRSYFAGMGKVSSTRIEELIRAYTGADTTCTFHIFDDEGNCRLDVIFERGDETTLYWSDIYALLEKMLPAHIEYRIMVSYPTAAVVVGKSRKHYKTLYCKSGTLPNVVLLADINTVETVVENDSVTVTSSYKQAAEDGIQQQAGLYPNVTTLADVNTVDSVAEATAVAVSMSYRPCGIGYSTE